MKTQTFIFTIGILLIIGLAVFFINKPSVPDEVQSNTETTENVESTPEVTSMTAAEVATHNTEQDCRIIVGDKVYDVTPWIPKHPGGPKAILSLCGTDATATFTKQHGSNQKAQAALKSFFIADLTT